MRNVFIAAVMALQDEAVYVGNRSKEFKVAMLNNILGRCVKEPSTTGKDLIEEALKYEDPKDRADVTYISVSRIMGGEFICINLVVSTNAYPVRATSQLTAEGGVLAYVYNITAPCSVRARVCGL